MVSQKFSTRKEAEEELAYFHEMAEGIEYGEDPGGV